MRSLLPILLLLFLLPPVIADSVTVNVIVAPPIRETLGPFFGIAVSLMVLGTFLWAWKIAKTSASIAIFAYIAIIIIASLTILSTL